MFCITFVIFFFDALGLDEGLFKVVDDIFDHLWIYRFTLSMKVAIDIWS
jgi:hypothetical protein